MEDLKIKEGDIGLFEFQIKRGVVDENEIEDEDVQSLVDKLKKLCSDNTSVKISYDDELMVTISVNFEIPLNADISTNKLEEYLPESGAWAVASASPGWIYAASDGDNVWFKGVK